MMKKKNLSMPAAVCFIFVVAVLVVQINVSVFWKLKTMPHSPTSTSHAVNSGTQRSAIERGPLVSHEQWPNPTSAIACDRSHRYYDVCSIGVPTMLDSATATFFPLRPPAADQAFPPETIRPYPRKWEDDIMARIREFSLTTAPAPAPCDVVHQAPAIVFSASGYVGNFFHEFSDVLIPLFITVHSIYSGTRDFIPVIENAANWWVEKYGDLLAKFSKHPILIINRTAGSGRHCFPSATVGLISHGLLTIDSRLIPTSKNLSDFHELLDRAYGQRPGNSRDIATTSRSGAGERRPRLVFTVRGHGVGRVLLNQEDVRKAAEAAGFEVVVFEPAAGTPLKEAYKLMKSSHAFVGVHGAALTHLLFLRPGAVFLQIMPLGTDWASEVCYGGPAKALGLDYMEYKIGVEESSLTAKYGREHRLVKDPIGSIGNRWGKVMDIYLKEQNVTLDLARFRGTLEKAYVMARKFMEDQG